MQLGKYLALKGSNNLPDIVTSLLDVPQRELRSLRRMLIGTLRYMRTHGIQATSAEWSMFARKTSALIIPWDEAKQGRYRYRVPSKDAFPFSALAFFLKSALDKTPPGWYSSVQTRQYYRYATKHARKDVRWAFPPQIITQSSEFSVRDRVIQQFPEHHSSFIGLIASGRVDTISGDYWINQQPTLLTNDKWIQGAFALARYNGSKELAQSIHSASWYNPTKPLIADTGLALSFFEIIQRLPTGMGRPAWMTAAFGKMLSKEKNASFIERGWKAVNFTEDERFALILSLAKDYPCNVSRAPLSEVLQYQWTLTEEKRKALTLSAYQSFGKNQHNTGIDVLLTNAKEWIALLVPELKMVLDLNSGIGPGLEVLQLETFLSPANTNNLELPQDFNDSTEVCDAMPK